MMADASGEFRNTGSATVSSAWECLLLFVLSFARLLIGAVDLVLIGVLLFSYAPVAGRSRHARRYNLGGALTEKGLVPTRAARSWRRRSTPRGRGAAGGPPAEP
jgi:hypothetical protein